VCVCVQVCVCVRLCVGMCGHKIHACTCFCTVKRYVLPSNLICLLFVRVCVCGCVCTGMSEKECT